MSVMRVCTLTALAVVVALFEEPQGVVLPHLWPLHHMLLAGTAASAQRVSDRIVQLHAEKGNQHI